MERKGKSERALTERGAGRPGDDVSHQLTCWSADVTIQNYKYFKMETDGLDDLFLSDSSDSEDDIEETLYAKPATTYVSTGEKICSDCNGKVLGTDPFFAETQQCHHVFTR